MSDAISLGIKAAAEILDVVMDARRNAQATEAEVMERLRNTLANAADDANAAYDELVALRAEADRRVAEAGPKAAP